MTRSVASPCRSVVLVCALSSFVVLFGLAASPAAGLGVLGSADRVPAATLLVPFVEVGATAAGGSQDTRMVVYNTAPYDVLVRYQLWNVHGVAVPGVAGNVELASGATWSDSARRLVEAATEADRALLLDGDFFRGFATIDVVEAEAELTPLDFDYPFSYDNRLLGYVYYTRLEEGSANGLAMVAIESVPFGITSNDVPIAVTGFYGELLCVILCAPDFGQGRREQLGLQGRACAAEASHGGVEGSGGCQGPGIPGAILRSRLFASDALVASSRTIVFSWLPGWQDGAPTPGCERNSSHLDCETDFAYVRRREDGTIAESGRLELPRVVNVIESTGDARPGELLIEVAPSDLPIQWYVFSFNSAQPPGQPDVHWDAIFEGSVEVLP